MTQQPRSIIDDTEEHRLDPFTARRHDFKRAVMSIEVPECSHVVGLVATHLTLHQARLGALDARGAPGAQAPALEESLRLEEPADRRVGRHRAKLGLLLSERP